MTLVFLDHSFHQKTLSTLFLQKAWVEAGWNVVCLWDAQWNGGHSITVDEIVVHKPDIVLSFQILKPAAFYRQIRCPRILLVPMYDSSRGMKPWDWWEYRGFSFLHFSRKLHQRLERLGIPGTYLQYFPDPNTIPCRPWSDRSAGIFYWQRVENIPYPAVASFIRVLLGKGPHRFHLHRAIDPGESPEPVDSTELILTQSHWFSDQEALQRLLIEQKIFIAPRMAEGIGMSFLEAMAMGCAVIAQNDATMNEYITHGHNGILVDWAQPDSSVIQERDLELLGLNARRSVEEGYPLFHLRQAALIRNWENLFTMSSRVTWRGTIAAVLYAYRHLLLRPVKKLMGNWNV